MKNKSIQLYIIGMATLVSQATMARTQDLDTQATDTTNQTISKEAQLSGITVTSKAGMRRMGGPINGVSIGRQELFRAACCNLGESFSTNPSVDVAYNDAATGAKQIKLLGLSGTYVQMLTENMPNFRGAALPFALGYVPGAWMKGIQVSKGNASVKNGYESITGQINIDYKKPEDPEQMEINLFGDSKSRMEANIDGNVHLDGKTFTNVMAHFENNFTEHDGNGDGFYDKPKVRQLNLRNHWKWRGDRYLFHGGWGLLTEKRIGGQMNMDHTAPGTDNNAGRLFDINIRTDRYDGYMKHAFILDQDHNTNLALMATASMHKQNARYGDKAYYVNEKNLYASLMFETDFSPVHNLSAGLSLNHDYLSQQASSATEPSLHANDYSTGHTAFAAGNERETTPGAYAQYTLNLRNRLTVMTGLRIDHSDQYGTFLTPRFHLKWMPTDIVSLRLSAGKGYRTVHFLAENHNLLASGRTLVIDDGLKQEEAWNLGASGAFNIPLAGKTLKTNVEYYYTTFRRQAIVDYDTDPKVIHVYNLDGKAYSHTFQVDATYPFFDGFTLTAAYRLNDVKATYNGVLRERPLTSRYKGLLTAQYKTPMEKWQFDVTLQLNGGGRMPTPYQLNDVWSWAERYHAFEQLSAQVTREFRHFTVYAGGENLTGFRQSHPIIQADHPWSDAFDPTMIWGPVEGRMFYAGIRVRIG